MGKKSLLGVVIFCSLCLLLSIGANASMIISSPTYNFGKFDQLISGMSYKGGFVQSRLDYQNSMIEFYMGGYVSSRAVVVPDAERLFNSLKDKNDYIMWLNAQLNGDIKEYIKQAVKSLDANNDGNITEDEAKNLQCIVLYLKEKQGKTDEQIMAYIYQNGYMLVSGNVYNKETGVLEFSYTILPPDQRGEQVKSNGQPLWDPKNGIINGYRAEVTLYDNGRVFQIVGWTMDSSGVWVCKKAFYYDNNNDGINEAAGGDSTLLGVDSLVGDDKVVYVTFNSYGVDMVFNTQPIRGEGNDSTITGYSKGDKMLAEAQYNIKGQQTTVKIYNPNDNTIIIHTRIYDDFGNVSIEKVYKNEIADDKLVRETKFTYERSPSHYYLWKVTQKYDEKDNTDGKVYTYTITTYYGSNNRALFTFMNREEVTQKN
ncbi:MAG: hypothetical protein NC820_06665 [Candidatus Omnitrophica bacterium]|nr:hypothetical protein [Candidatus Omnitrophota bacterium]